MIVIFNGQILATETATQEGYAKLIGTMQHAKEQMK